MVALGNDEFLQLWEAGYRLHPLDRAIQVIRASLEPCDMTEEVAVADWLLGQRNRALARVRMLYFGPRLEGWTACRECGETLEFRLDCQAIANFPVQEGLRSVAAAGGVYRLPTSRDLARVANVADVQRAACQLLESCELEGARGADEGWTDEAVSAVAASMAEADPMAEIALSFECPLCGYASEEVLDLAAFLWVEIESRAKRLMAEVHAMAAAYGWAEATILAMSDVRRAGYLRMIDGNNAAGWMAPS